MAVHPSRRAYVEDEPSQAAEQTYDLSNVPIDTDYDLPANPNLPGGNTARASAVLAEFSRKRAAAAIAVPTDDVQVRSRLRELNEPMTVFGERPEDRRDRLRGILYALQAGPDTEMEDGVEDTGKGGQGDLGEGDEAEQEEQEFYTAGTQALVDARKDILRYSMPRAKRRVDAQRIAAGIELDRHVEHRSNVRERLGGFELFGSQVAGDRPVSMVRFAPDGEMLAAGNWGGGIKLLGVPDLEEKMLLRGHNTHVSGISWLAEGITEKDSNTVKLASGGGEGHVNLWSTKQDTPLATLHGHSGRVCRVEFHPSGRYLASASYDTTWRLWDVETTTELLLQEGHSREAYAIAFNTDGSLVASAGLDSIACLWDIRTGRRILYFENHIAPIYALDWSVDGYRIMSGSADGFAKCWDIRAMKETASIGAHKGGVTDLRWYKGMDGPMNQHGDMDGIDVTDPKPAKAGTFFVSGGFDKNVNIFSSDDWVLCKSLSGHSGNVLAVDVTADAKWIASSSHDRTVKLWARDDMEAL